MTVITEFDAGDPDATMHALADEILKDRRALRLLARAIDWADAGAPFGLFPPGPLWRPQRTIEGDDGARSGGPQSTHRSAMPAAYAAGGTTLARAGGAGAAAARSAAASCTPQ